MALPPTLKALSIGPATAPHVLELYLDYLCPFSAKMLQRVHESVVPLLFGKDAPYRDQVRLVLRPVPQPWHASSTYLHEAALAVARLAPHDDEVLADPARNPFYVFSVALMRANERWFEAPVRSKSGDEVRAELVTFAVDVLSEQRRRAGEAPLVTPPEGTSLTEALHQWTRVSDDGNTGSQIVPDLKYCIKLGRQTGIHVTPTALWNGVVEASIQSSMSSESWQKFFQERVTTPARM